MASLFQDTRKTRVDVTDQLLAMLDAGVPVAANLSGGKDSHAMAFAVLRFLREKGYRNKVIAIHADLGMIEWAQSGPQSRRIADMLELELLTVRGIYGGQVEHWEQRHIRNWERFRSLALTSMITPFSMPRWRDCTKSSKIEPIEKELRRYFAGPVIQAIGIRHLESSNRALAPITKKSGSGKLAGSLTWNAIATWSEADVWAEIAASGLARHEAYDLGNERVSCSFCIMGSENDLMVAVSQPQHLETYRRLVALEQKSLHAFQQGKWLMRMRPDLLLPEQEADIDNALKRAMRLKQLQADIPTSVRLENKKPVCIPDLADAQLYADIRRNIFDLFSEEPINADPELIREIYAKSIDLNQLGIPRRANTQSTLFDLATATA